ncbi:hypothetical protein ESCO_004282 [Escovopsis weberi]|uniref:VPS37 C-terminal domain-containing protein n=1 Tax=Escovopsis weberi TaxID=150374 RepID=A0A0M8N5H7_ESCWE|nr:hypothetical protein ESCO_004282 [Escovopsis weberi]
MASLPPEGPGPAPPVLPPKPSSQDTSRMGTPAGPSSPQRAGAGPSSAAEPHAGAGETLRAEQPSAPPDPGEQWLPQVLQDKSKQDLLDILSSPALLDAVTHAPASIHPSLALSHRALSSALRENVALAQQLAALEARLAALRSATQARLLSTHALERQWRKRQADADTALAGFAPAGLYQLLARGVAEQAAVCAAMEDSFLEAHEGAGLTGEREAGDWIRRYREARVQYYLRQERKERWDEGRVGGWR